MSTSNGIALRPMGLLEIVDQTFRLYRRDFGLFFGIAALVYIPLGVLQSVPEIAMIMTFVFAPFYAVAGAALTKAVSDRYLGEKASIGSAYRYIGRRIVPFLLTLLVSYLFVAVGLVLLVIPGIVFLFWIMLVAQVFVIEDRRYLDAVWRGRFLVGNGVWAELIVLGIITGVLGALIGAVVGAVFGLILPEPGAQASLAWGVILGGIQALTTPIGLVATVLLYYDSRIRKEGFDLQMLAREMGTSTAMPAPPTTGPEAPSGGGPQTG